jgi:hypothetical protein
VLLHGYCLKINCSSLRCLVSFKVCSRRSICSFCCQFKGNTERRIPRSWFVHYTVVNIYIYIDYCVMHCILLCLTPDYFTLSNTRWFTHQGESAATQWVKKHSNKMFGRSCKIVYWCLVWYWHFFYL